MRYTDQFLNLAKQGRLSESTLVKMSEFKDRLEDHAIKIAVKTQSELQLPFSKMLLLAGAVGAAAPIAGVIEDAIESWRDNRLKEPSFNKMLEYHPQLKNEDMTVVRRYFDSIWHFSPHMAQDPLAAGSYIRSAMQYHESQGGPIPNMVGDLANLQKNMSTASGKSATSRFLDLSKLTMPGLSDQWI